MSSVAGAKLATASFLLAVLIELWRSQDCHQFATKAQRQRRDAVETLFVGAAHRKHNRHRLVRGSAVEQTAEMLTLQELALSHESCQRSRPALGQHLHPLQVQLCMAITHDQPRHSLQKKKLYNAKIPTASIGSFISQTHSVDSGRIWPKLHLAWHFTSRLDNARHVGRVERVETSVSSRTSSTQPKCMVSTRRAET